MKAAHKPFEIVFVSSDQDAGQFKEYHGSQPWHAVPYGSQEMQMAGQTYQVQGIPRLIVLGPQGNVICPDGRQAGLSAANVDAWAKSAGLA